MSANGASATFGWDGMKRETSRTLPSGQVINHEYGLGSAPGASWHKVTTGISPNFRWTKTVFDGFGRTLEVISGYKVGSTETAMSKVKTEYAPCACSSIGKMKRTSMPYAASGGPAHWTTYDYDEIGRTVKVTPPGNAGFTSYEYGGTTVKTIDPKGKWKKFENDALGNLIKVREPRPGGGADYETVYTYTMLGKLNTVTMARPGKGLNPATVTQVRTFTYNSGGQTTSISHPENGTVSFLYNPDGSVQRKTDAKSQRVEWTYTPEGRPATVQKFWANGTEDTCSRVTYEYGAQTIDGGFAGTNLQGRVASATTGCTGQRGGKVDELYSYNVAGAVVTKRVRITRGVSTVTKDIVYTYDGEGKLASTKYPDEAKPWVMGYDAMARPNGLTQEWWDGNNNQWVNRQWVNGVSYGNAGQLLGMSTFSGIQNFAEVRFTETREYNERLQMTRQRTLQGATLAMDLRYVFTNGANPNNDGRIIQRENVLSGETVSYAYDSLQRLVNAETTSTAWGLSFDYDGFGNRWEQLVMKGTAPGNVVSFNQATNRINSSSYSHDANGNMLATPTVSGMTYDVENRLLTANGNGSLEEFAYLGDNKRVWKKATQGGTPVEQYYLYGVGGQRIATYSAVYSGGTLTLTYASKDVYFGGRVIWQNGKAVVQDRLGSVMARGNGVGGVETHDYFPYGEERTATVGDRNKFGTYHRDQTGLDYADQRYYNSAIGRFLSSDPYEASSGASDPGSWGRQAYVDGDPVNWNDPSGLYKRCPAGTRVAADAKSCIPKLSSGGGGGGGASGPANGSSLEAPPPGDDLNSGPMFDVDDALIDVFNEINEDVRAGSLSNCGAFARFAANALALSTAFPGALTNADMLMRPTRDGGRAFNFNVGVQAGGGWNPSFRDSGGMSNQGGHAMSFFVLGYYARSTPENSSGLIAASYLREWGDAWRLSGIPDRNRAPRTIAEQIAWTAANINMGDFHLGVAAGLLGGSLMPRDNQTAEARIRNVLCSQ